MTTTTIRVSEDLRDDLNLLRRMAYGKQFANITEMIRALLDARGFNEEFFERIREKVSE